MLAQNIVLLWERYILTGVIRQLYVFHDEGPYHKKNQSMDFLCKSINWFLYERDHHHESVTYTVWTVSVFGVFLVRLFGIFFGPYLHCRSLYPFRLRENTDQKNSKYGHFLRSATHKERSQLSHGPMPPPYRNLSIDL